MAEPRFSINAMQVLHARYLLKDKNGLVIETPEQMFHRVAKNIAGKDKKLEEDFFQMMFNLEFLPNSPCLMNAGTEIQQLSACFTNKQPISTNNGMELIENIKKGDQVISHEGKIRKVAKTYKRYFEGEIYKIKVKGLLNPTLSVTEEHPILSIKKEDISCKRIPVQKCNGFLKDYCLKKSLQYSEDCQYLKKERTQLKWMPIKDLSVGDYVLYNTLKEIKDVDEINLLDYLEKKENYCIINGYIYQKNRDKQFRCGKISSQVNKIKNRIKIDKELMLVFGYYLSEGDIDNVCLRFTFNKKEDYGLEVIKIVKQKFGLNSKIEPSKKGNWSNVRFHSKILSEFFKNLFGKGFNKKRIPPWITLLPLDKQFYLLVGLFRGDGCHYNGKSFDRIDLSLSNYQLSQQVLILLNRQGYHFNIHSTRPNGSDNIAYRLVSSPSECEDLVTEINKNRLIERKRFRQYILLDNLILRRINKIEKIKYKGEVYNLEVEKEHSYLANGIAVHNCFVLPVHDSLKGIFDTVKLTALIHQTGGGTGFSFSDLRPRGSIVGTTRGIASGPVSFMRVFDVTTDVIKQGGKRRGANMGVLRVDHPDILEFIKAKDNEKELQNFNISVGVTDEFMYAAFKNKDYDLIDPKTKRVVKSLNARKVFKLIVQSAWKTGDPGILFLDEINRTHMAPGVIEATNPCGEVPLLSYESCNLGSINLTKFVKGKEIDWDRLEKTVHLAVEFLDLVIDRNRFVNKEIEEQTLLNRKIGLGVMGWAETLIMLGIPYNSTIALKLGERLMKFIHNAALEKSVALGKEKGSFPNLKNSKWNYKHLRNATVTTIAPTGTISIIAGCSSGIEPVFSLCFVRNVLEGAHLLEINPLFEKVARERGFYSEALMNKIAKKGSIKGIQEVPKDVQRLFVSAFDIKSLDHIRMQAAFQKAVDNAVSKTVNLKNNATINDVKNIYLLAYKLKCKGVTVYRYGSKSNEVLTLNNKIKANAEYSGGCAGVKCVH